MSAGGVAGQAGPSVGGAASVVVVAQSHLPPASVLPPPLQVQVVLVAYGHDCASVVHALPPAGCVAGHPVVVVPPVPPVVPPTPPVPPVVVVPPVPALPPVAVVSVEVVVVPAPPVKLPVVLLPLLPPVPGGAVESSPPQYTKPNEVRSNAPNQQ